MYTVRAAILFIFLFFTSVLPAQEKDTLRKKELSLLLAGGTQTSLKGVYFTGGISFSKSKMLYTLQYNYSHSNAVSLNHFKGFLEKTNSASLLAGYRFSVYKFDLLLNGGITVGAGRFKSQSTDGGSNNMKSYSYFETGFYGLTFNGTARYNLTKKLNLGLSFTTFLNYYFQRQVQDPNLYEESYKAHYLNKFFGLQLSAGYKFKTW